MTILYFVLLNVEVFEKNFPVDEYNTGFSIQTKDSQNFLIAAMFPNKAQYLYKINLERFKNKVILPDIIIAYVQRYETI